MKIKKRLDKILEELYPAFSRNYIQSLIMQGKVKVEDKIITKSGTLIDVTKKIDVHDEKPKFVSRAGYKLEHALKTFEVDVTGYTCLDAGISTGGFTDCLLQHGAIKIYGVDVGYGQVDEKIRSNERVILFEKTNLKNLRDLGEQVDLITLDLSFISLTKVIEPIKSILKPNGKLITLIKPQFEAGKGEVPRGGVIKDPDVWMKVIESVKSAYEAKGFKCTAITESPILGTMGNKEFLACFIKSE